MDASGIPVFCSFNEIVPIKKAVPNPNNPNRHPPEQIRLLAKIIKAQGWRSPIVMSRRSGFIVKGHGRLMAAEALDVDEVPVDWQEYATEAEEWADLQADNQIAELAEWDSEAAVAKMLEFEDEIDLELFGIPEGDLKDLLKEAEEPPDDPGAQIDRAEELKHEWKTEYGQVWEIPSKSSPERCHRVMCGDSTSEEDVGKLLGDAKPFIMVTDPPYGVEYDPTWRREYDNRWQYREGKVQNDDRVEWTLAYKLFPGHVAYVWHSGRFAADLVINLRDADFDIRTQIIWKKQSLVMGRGHYHWQHEPCWYAVRPGGSAKWCGDRTQSTIWEIENVHRTQGSKNEDQITTHGTQKPLECMARPIRNHGSKEDDVYDPFLGSGTTVIAAERAGRICYGMEIDPGYCAVILQRCLDMGLEPKKVS